VSGRDDDDGLEVSYGSISATEPVPIVATLTGVFADDDGDLFAPRAFSESL
jgi:hypothetical protein